MGTGVKEELQEFRQEMARARTKVVMVKNQGEVDRVEKYLKGKINRTCD